MDGLELIEALTAAGIDGGWVISDGKIILWENESPIPDHLQEFAELN